ncbi:hypothetical protein H0H93_014361 [Arthromyces matolae]|nr:hypothetical protein H0H93_014361 [Arthromyces matolae]
MKATPIAYSSNPLIHRMIDGAESADSPNGVHSRPGFVSPSGLPPSPDLSHHDPQPGDQEALPPLVVPPSPSESLSSHASTEFVAHASPPELGSSSGSGSPSPPHSPGPRTPSPVQHGVSTADIEFASSPPLLPSSPVLDLPHRRRRASSTSTSNRSTSPPAKRHKPL